MPVISVDWWKGNDRAQREELVSELTASVSRIAGCPKEAVTVIVRDVEPGHWGKGGVLADVLLADTPTDAPTPQDTGARP
ncbi:4-oxalocrotonate tautomerase family protein [Streptomyces sp. NBC_01341]|uniref:tautomerase family protein n=1 Tax=Streptomyces sp. NBC_01341 TaxID=2903831 RepID=UPI002E154278|nr:4-oxalocrotonate tautomerase family protein [Streptomyces sp. NBC_01341]